MADGPGAHVEHWVVQASSTALADEEDLHSALLVARGLPGATSRGGRMAQPSPLVPCHNRAVARSANHAAATAPHTRREQANMWAVVIVARELLRCRLLESGREALLERVAELLDAAFRGALFYTRPTSQAVVRERALPDTTTHPLPGSLESLSAPTSLAEQTAPL